MSDLIRMLGMNSGLDTESIISAYTSKTSTRLDKARNSLTKNKWTQTAWQGLNSKIYSFYANTLSTNRMSSAYAKKKVTTSNSALSVVAGNGSVNGIQTAKIGQQATAAYLTGSKIDITKGDQKLTESLGIAEGSQITLTKKDGTSVDITIGSGEGQVNTMEALTSKIKSAGLSANFDTGNQRLFVSSKDTGEANDFNFSGDAATLFKLGIADGTKIDAQNAKLTLNGAEFESSSNTFTINGATYTINSMPTNPDEEISVTTATDYDGIYDVVKNMLKEYNSLVNEMSKLYNADSAKGYEPLTDEQKDAMSEKEIDEWETKIKDSLLRKDENLYNVMSVLTDVAAKGFDVGGKKMYLSDFGISTMGYFSAEENERYALHIDGDKDDTATAGKEDKLKSMIAADPEKVQEFFTSFSNALYKDLYSKMGTSSLSSVYKVYNDKKLASEQTDWEKKITDLESQLSDMEDKYYKKFSTMETALAKLQSKQTAAAGLFGQY